MIQDSMPEVHSQNSSDSVKDFFIAAARGLFLLVFGLLPVLCLPYVVTSFEYTKTFFVSSTVLVSAILIALATLRSGSIQISSIYVLGSMWLVGAAALVSSLLSGDRYDSFIADLFSNQSSLFIVLMAAVATLVTLVGGSKTFTIRLYLMLTLSTLLLALFQLLRVLFDGSILSLGLFSSVTNSLLGNWNDLALYFGLVIIIAIMAMEQLSIARRGRIIIGVLVALSTAVLMVVNTLFVWVVVAGVSLISLMYTLSHERFENAPQLSSVHKKTITKFSLGITLGVFSVATIFIIGGSGVGGFMSRVTGIDYLAVKPSFLATTDILRSSTTNDPLFGVGANRFSDAWRVYKDQSINETIFWSTNFPTGSGFFPTQFVTTGLVGGLAWVGFIVLYFLIGLRTLFGVTHQDKVWYFLASSSFVAAMYFWLLLWIYNPSTTILLMAALFTGISLTAFGILKPERTKQISVQANKGANLLLIGCVMIVIVGSVSLLYYSARHYTSAYQYLNAIAQSGTVPLEQTEQRVANAYSIVQSETYAQQLLQYQIAKMNSLLTVTEPTPEQQQVFQDTITLGVSISQQIAANSRSPLSYKLAGDFYSALAVAQITEATQRARDAYAAAQAIDPLNPIYPLLNAQLSFLAGENEQAKEFIQEALALKSNFTDALLLQAQIAVGEENVASAIETTRSIISIEPNNPARYYQLGILLSSDGQEEAARSAFERAVILKPNYSNARYYLALVLNNLGESEAALAQLDVVLELNPNNEQVLGLIEQITSGEVAPAVSTDTIESIPEVSAVQEGESETTTTADDLETPLIVPVSGSQESESDTSDTNEADE